MEDPLGNDALEMELPSLETILRSEVRARWFSPAQPQTFSGSLDSSLSCSLSFTQTNIGKYTLASPSKDPIPINEAKSYNVQNCKTSNVVRCNLCPKLCHIKENEVGFCSARINRGGRLLTRFYGRPTSVAVDPIEKKPLFHFLPGTKVLSLGTRGCNLACKFCQNWQISRPIPVNSTIQQVLDPRQVVSLAQKHNCPSVAFTYNEPTIWAEYVIDVARLCRKNGIKTIMVTNGMIVGQAREELYREIDAANVDLKGFTTAFYSKLVCGSLEAVKSTLKYIVRKTDVWLEITNLLIPTKNDSPAEIEDLCQWITKTLGRDVPLHFSAFFPTWRLTDVPPTPVKTLRQAADIAKKMGISYVYCGNVSSSELQKTFCPKCGLELISREKYSARILSTMKTILPTKGGENRTAFNNSTHSVSTDQYCQRCGTKIVGIFA